ncbi:peptidylprolyl isomerase, partial [Klebsiella oxytoca]
RMRTGERWTVYLPWDMGYGTSDRDGMPGYSVLVFDIKLESVVSDY